ncbi:MAG TPA: glyceraldehyde 3-phosphate dehydrogenase NAD-binding domain-containing protein, partial [Sphingobacteriaceae bacterium]|nr:glyceraldehyde 3-phosphate dehydrogenase NAD-binding domain-containing protein [Sphingobacteriaceae bacterium]
MIQPAAFEGEIKSYKDKQNKAVDFIKIVSDLWFNKSIELVLFRNQLIDRRVSVILNLHQNTTALTNDRPLHIDETLRVAEAVHALHLAPSRIDIGKLTLKMRENRISEDELPDFVKNELLGADKHESFDPRDVVLYGFGRIGRLLARELISKAGGGRQLRLRAIVTRDHIDADTLRKRATLLRNDSIHGDFEGEVEIDVQKNALIMNG